MSATQASPNNTATSPVVSPVPTPNPEITRLTGQIEPLKTKAERLDLVNIGLLYAAGAVAVAIALFAFWSSRVNRNLRGLEADLGKAKDAQFSLALATQQERAAKAELRVEELRKRQDPRRLNFDAFLKALKDKPTAKGEILYQPNDPEASGLATELWQGLGVAGWTFHQPAPIPTDAVVSELRRAPREFLERLPPTLRVGAQPLGISIIANSLPEPAQKDLPFNILSRALLDCGFSVGGGLDRSLPDNVFLIVVGPKP